MLKFNIRNQSLSRVDHFRPAEKSINYLTAEFRFLTDEWTGDLKLRAKAQNGKIVYEATITDGVALVPWEVLRDTERFSVSVFARKGDVEITTNYVEIVLNGTLPGGSETNPPTPTEMDLLRQEVEEMWEYVRQMEIEANPNIIVTFSTEDGTSWTADKTFEEVKEAVDNGVAVYGRYSDFLYDLYSLGGGEGFGFIDRNRTGNDYKMFWLWEGDSVTRQDGRMDMPSLFFKGAVSAEYNGSQSVRVEIPTPDWNQNDPTAADYVKNRTHYEEVVEEYVIFEGALDSFTTTTDIPITYPIPVGTSVTAYYNGAVVATVNMSQYQTNENNAIGYFTPDLTLFVYNDTRTIDVYNGTGTETLKFVTTDFSVLKQFDEKYIPDSIARTVDIPTDDHIMEVVMENLSTWEGGSY